MDFLTIKEKVNIKKLIAIVVALFVAFEIVATVAVCESFLNAKGFAQSKKAEGVVERELSPTEYVKWLDNVAQSITEESFEGLYIKNNDTSHSSIILLHSLTTGVSDMAVYASHFYELGFNVYIPEYIADSCTMGIKEKEKIAQIVNAIVEKDERSAVFVFGIGVGATASILATTEGLPQNVKGIIADTPYSSVYKLFKENIKNVYGLPSFPIVQLSSLYIKLTRGWEINSNTILSAARASEIPILYIHGTEDPVVHVEHSNNLFEITQAKGTDHVTIHGATHLQGLNTNPEKYWREIEAFVRNSMD